MPISNFHHSDFPFGLLHFPGNHNDLFKTGMKLVSIYEIGTVLISGVVTSDADLKNFWHSTTGWTVRSVNFVFSGAFFWVWDKFVLYISGEGSVVKSRGTMV